MKLLNNDLLNEERIVKRNSSVDDGYSGGYSSGMTLTFNEGSYRAEYNPDKYQQKKYSAEDVDKIVTMLTLAIDDVDTRIAVEELYESMKDTDKI